MLMKIPGWSFCDGATCDGAIAIYLSSILSYVKLQQRANVKVQCP